MPKWSKWLQKQNRKLRKKQNLQSSLPTLSENVEGLDQGIVTSTGVRVKGSVRRNYEKDAEIIEQLNGQYYDPEFKSTDYVMDHLPDIDATQKVANDTHIDLLSALNQHVEQETESFKQYESAVQRRFKTRLLHNSHQFLLGMRQIREVQLDLRLTESKCKNARSTLSATDQSLIHECFGVISIYQKRKRYVKVFNHLCSIQKLFDTEKALDIALENSQFLEAIDLHSQLITKLDEMKGITALDKMRTRFRGGNAVITERLEKTLGSIMAHAPKIESETLGIVLESYYRLREFYQVNSILETAVCDALEATCTKVICKHLGYSDNYASKQGNNYRKLCKRLTVSMFMECFMDICGRVFDILHCYYKIESIVAQFRNTHNNLATEDMQLLRKQLWVKTQTLLGDLLETSQFSSKSKIKMEDLLLALHGAEVFRIIGQAFSGSESRDLEASIRAKCKQYLDHFRRDFFESMKSTFDNEMWIVLPIPKNFGVHGIKELHRNPTLTMFTFKNAVSPDESKSEEDTNTESKSDEDDTTDPNSPKSIANGVTDTVSSPEPIMKRGQPNVYVYQQFLSGDNIFDFMLENKKKNDDERRGTAQSAFATTVDPAYNHGMSISKPKDDGTEPVLTSASLNIARHMGRCLQIMECLDPVAVDAFRSLRDAFFFYLYHVFIWFGVQVSHFFSTAQNPFASTFDRLSDKSAMNSMQDIQEKKRKEQVAQHKYPKLTKQINLVNDMLCSRMLAPELDDLIKKKMTRPIRRPPNLPPSAKCLMEAADGLDLEGSETMEGVASRFVATETLTFLVEIITTVQSRVLHHVPRSYHDDVKKFVKTANEVVKEFKTYMYRNVPTLLVNLGRHTDHGSIPWSIKKARWDRKDQDLITEPNSYVAELLGKFGEIERVLSSHATLPRFIHHKLNEEAMIYVQEQLVAAYSDLTKCTMQGRALMSLDQSELKKGLQQLKNTEPMPTFEYMTSFIQAFYLPEQDLLKWVEEHPEYPLRVVSSFSKVGRAAEPLKRRERPRLEQRISQAHGTGREKKKELDSKLQ